MTGCYCAAHLIGKQFKEVILGTKLVGFFSFSFKGGKIRTLSYLIVNFNVNCTLNQKLIMHFR